MFAAVDVRLEDDCVFSNLAQMLKAEALESAAVGENRPVPGHEAVQPAQAFDYLDSGSQVEMVGIGEDYLRADGLEVGRVERLHGPQGSHRHERGRRHVAVRRMKRSAAGATISRIQGENWHLQSLA